MKPKKLLVILTALSVFLLLLGLFLPWMRGGPTGKTTMEKVGNNVFVSVQMESISGWRVIFTGLSPACMMSTFGPNWTVLPLVIPIVAILAIIFVLIPWRKRLAIKRDGYLLIGMGIVTIVSQFVWKESCPAEIVAKWSYSGGEGHWSILFGMLLMIISGMMIVFAKPPKPVIENANRIIEYRTCLKCKETVDKTLSNCPHCGNQLN